MRKTIHFRRYVAGISTLLGTSLLIITAGFPNLSPDALPHPTDCDIPSTSAALSSNFSAKPQLTATLNSKGALKFKIEFKDGDINPLCTNSLEFSNKDTFPSKQTKIFLIGSAGYSKGEIKVNLSEIPVDGRKLRVKKIFTRLRVDCSDEASTQSTYSATQLLALDKVKLSKTTTLANFLSGLVGSKLILALKKAQPRFIPSANFPSAADSPPVVTSQLQNKTFYTKQDILLRIGVSGTFPMQYDWEFTPGDGSKSVKLSASSGIEIYSDASGSTLIIRSALVKIARYQGGTFKVTASNAFGTATSSTLGVVIGGGNPPPPPSNSPTPIASPTATPGETAKYRFDRAMQVLNMHCMGCHGAGVYNWSAFTSDQAWIDSGLVTAGSMGTSKINTRLKYGGGIQDMPVPPLSNAFTQADYDILRHWIVNMQGGGGGNSEITPTDGSFYRGTTDFIRIGDRFFVQSVLKDIYGPSANDTAFWTIFSRLSFFGGPCDSKEFFTYTDTNPNSYAYPRGNTTKINGMNCDGVDLGDDHASLTPQSSALRAGFLAKACLSINAIDAAVQYAATGAGGNANTWPTAANIIAAYQRFYPGRTIPPTVQTSLTNIVSGAQSNFPSTPLQGWRFLLTAICDSPDWQQP